MTMPPKLPPGPTPLPRPSGAAPGQPFVAPFPHQYSAPGQPPKTKSRAQGRIVAIVLAVLVLLGAGLIGLGWYTTNQREQASHEAMIGFLDALQAGSASTALSYLDAGAVDEQNEPLLTDSALAANQDAFSYNPELSKIESTNTSYRYRASISINDINKVVEWSVSNLDDEWLVRASDVFTTLTIDAEMPHVINGAAIESGTTQVVALPGSYTVESGLPLLFYAPATSSFDLFTGGQAEFSGDLVMVEGIRDSVVEQVRTILNGCVAEKSPPTACGWPLPFDNGVVKDGSVNWTIIPDDPATTLTLPEGPWLASSNYQQNFTVRYETDANGLGVLDDGSEGYFDEYLEARSSVFTLDLSGSEAAVSFA